MAKRIVMPEVDEMLVRALTIIVDKLPRKVSTKTGKPHTGVLAEKVATNFYAYLDKAAHPMAAKNPDCSFSDPCGKCRRCMLQITSDHAKEAGLVVKIPRAATKMIDGRMKRSTWVTYYRPGEIAESGPNEAVMAELAGLL